uniref:(northern house mosquito) hypothetical protein n=1 Tax=Culex pipiens TaxID=7175 RepID=A0A8D8BUV9_CULPI
MLQCLEEQKKMLNKNKYNHSHTITTAAIVPPAARRSCQAKAFCMTFSLSSSRPSPAPPNSPKSGPWPARQTCPPTWHSATERGFRANSDRRGRPPWRSTSAPPPAR